MKNAVKQIVLALVCSAVVAWLLYGVNATWAQDATGEPVAEVIDIPAEVTAEAPTDITVEDGGTVVINEQPAEPAPAPAVDPNLQAILNTVLGLVLMFVITVFGKQIIDALKNSVPPFVFEPFLSAIDSVMQIMKANAERTADPTDDVQMAELIRKYEAWKTDLRAPNVPPTPPATLG
jgi:hypothetical protein